jgi:hypothetical protein
MKGRRQHNRTDQGQKQARVVQSLTKGLSHAHVEKHPPVGHKESGEEDDEDRRQEERFEDGPDGTGQTFRYYRDPIAEGQERISSRDRGVRSIRGSHQLRGPELLFYQEPDVVRGQVTLHVSADNAGDLGAATVAVYGLQKLVQQRWELQDLPVCPANQGGRLFESGVLVVAEQLDSGAPPWWPFDDLLCPWLAIRLGVVCDHHRRNSSTSIAALQTAILSANTQGHKQENDFRTDRKFSSKSFLHVPRGNL